MNTTASTRTDGKVSVSPAEFTLVKYDSGVIAGVVAAMAELLGVANPIHLVVDETTQLSKMSAEVADRSSDATITIRVESGALENTQRFTHFSEAAARQSIGQMLLRASDRMGDDFADVPSDLDLSLQQNTAWDSYCAGRLARAGLPINQQRFRYDYRNRFGFSDEADAAFDRIWAARHLGWTELTAAP